MTVEKNVLVLSQLKRQHILI